MKTGRKFLIMAGAVAVSLFGGLFSCSSEPEIEPVMTLYDKPLSTIKKVIEGKWKVYSSTVSAYIYTIDYPENMFIEFQNDHYTVYEEDGNQRTVYFTWKKLPVENRKSSIYECETYIMWNVEHNAGDQFFYSINNDTLTIEGYIFPESSCVVRVK